MTTRITAAAILAATPETVSTLADWAAQLERCGDELAEMRGPQYDGIPATAGVLRTLEEQVARLRRVLRASGIR